MSPADAAFIDVSTTVLVGTFIAYVVEQRLVPRALVPIPWVSALVRCLHMVPVLTGIALLTCLYATLLDTLPFLAKLIIMAGSTWSVTALTTNLATRPWRADAP